MTVFYFTTRPQPGPSYTTPLDAAWPANDPSHERRSTSTSDKKRKEALSRAGVLRAAEGNGTLTVSLEASRGSSHGVTSGSARSNYPADSSQQYPSRSQLRARDPARFPNKIPNTASEFRYPVVEHLDLAVFRSRECRVVDGQFGSSVARNWARSGRFASGHDATRATG